MTVRPATIKPIPIQPATSIVCPKNFWASNAVVTVPIPDHRTYKMPACIYFKANIQNINDPAYNTAAIDCALRSSNPLPLADMNVERTSQMIAPTIK